VVIEIESADEDAKSIDEIAEDIARYIIADGVKVQTLKTLLVQFAEEIKRGAIEP
jgi:hypothetical protein